MSRRKKQIADLLTPADRALVDRALRGPQDVRDRMSAVEAREFSKHHTSLPFQGTMLLLTKDLPENDQARERYHLLRGLVAEADESGELTDLLEAVVWEQAAFAGVAAWLACKGEHRRERGRRP